MTIILINDMKLSSGIYTASKQIKARTKITLIKFFFSHNIRSLCNTTHSNERYVPITGYRRQNYTKIKCINSLDHHKLIVRFLFTCVEVDCSIVALFFAKLRVFAANL